MPTPIQIQATKLELPFTLTQLENKKLETDALVLALGLTFEGVENFYARLVALGIGTVAAGEQYDSIDLTKSAGIAPVTLKVTEHPAVGLIVDTSTGTAIVAVEPSSSLSVTIEESKSVDVKNRQPLKVILTNENLTAAGGGGDGSNASLMIGLDPTEGFTDTLKPVSDNLGAPSKLSLSKTATEIQDTAVLRSSVNPVMRLLADSTSIPTAGDDMGTLRFTRNFEDPLDIDLARAIYNDFVIRVNEDGGTVEGSIQCVTAEILPIVAGEYLINTAEIRPEYSGILNSTNADMVFYVNDGGFPVERFRVQSGGDIVVKDPSAGVILHSQNNTPYRLVVTNDAQLLVLPLNATAPSITSLPLVTGTQKVWYTLTATVGTVDGNPTPTSVLQWQVSSDGTNWTDISGETSTTYTLISTDANKYIRVKQTASNALGVTTANSAPTGQIISSIFATTQYENIAPITWEQLTVQTWN